MITTRPTNADVRVVLDAAKPASHPPDITARVEEIWQTECAERGSTLFNGRLFSVTSCQSGLIGGSLVEYKWFVAQRRDPTLFPALQVRPLAVTGLLLCADGVLFGQRASHSEQDAGLWELAPAGGVDGSRRRPDGSIDLAAHVLAELAEETGIPNDAVTELPRPFALAEDAESHVLDVGLMLQTDLASGQIAAIFSSLPNREYTALKVVPVNEITAFAAAQGPRLATVSSALLGVSPLLG